MKFDILDGNKKKRGSIDLSLTEAIRSGFCQTDGYKLDPKPKTIKPEQDGWISIKFALPPDDTVVKVFPLSELNETAVLSFNGRVWYTDKKKKSTWNPKCITHWKKL
jgi:hypothetical protein